jgi:ATP-dependent protease Clp ATPase subunit
MFILNTKKKTELSMIKILTQNLFFIVIGTVIAILGIIIQQTRSYSMIAGFNTMSAEKRRTVNIEQVAIALRNAFILLGAVWIIIPFISDLLGFDKLKFWLLIGLHFIICILLIVIVNTHSKFKIKKNA